MSDEDAILFVTPEYNYAISGVMKNAIDWASRPSSNNSWPGKPAAVIGASTSALGTAVRAVRAVASDGLPQHVSQSA